MDDIYYTHTHLGIIIFSYGTLAVWHQETSAIQPHTYYDYMNSTLILVCAMAIRRRTLKIPWIFFDIN